MQHTQKGGPERHRGISLTNGCARKDDYISSLSTNPMVWQYFPGQSIQLKKNLRQSKKVH